MLDGGGSYDPDGDALTNWSFNRVPVGSTLGDADDAFTMNSSGTLPLLLWLMLPEHILLT